MPFVGPVTLLGRVIRRLNGIGFTRAAGNLAFTSLLGLVPLVTVAFAFVAQFPVFQDFLRVLENYLLRYTLPETASQLVSTFVVGMAAEAAKLLGVWILFVIVTAALVVDSVESEINAIFRIVRKRPILRFSAAERKARYVELRRPSVSAGISSEPSRRLHKRKARALSSTQ